MLHVNYSQNLTATNDEHNDYRTEQGLLIFAVCVTVLGSSTLICVLIKLKQSKEVDFPDMKQHFMAVKIGYALLNVLGSLLVYPLWLHIYRLASNGQYREISADNCRVVVFFMSFWLSNSVILHVALCVDRCLNWIYPFHYLIYKRTKNSKIPLKIMASSTCIAGICGFLATFRSGEIDRIQRTSGLLCVLDVTTGSPAVIFGLVLGYLCLATLMLAIVTFSVRFFKEKSERNLVTKHRGGGRALPRIPVGMSFLVALALTGLLSWTPFLVTTTVAQFHDVGRTTLRAMFVLLFVPSLIGPLVTYLTYDDVRAKFHELLRCPWRFIKQLLRR